MLQSMFSWACINFWILQGQSTHQQRKIMATLIWMDPSTCFYMIGTFVNRLKQLVILLFFKRIYFYWTKILFFCLVTKMIFFPLRKFPILARSCVTSFSRIIKKPPKCISQSTLIHINFRHIFSLKRTISYLLLL